MAPNSTDPAPACMVMPYRRCFLWGVRGQRWFCLSSPRQQPQGGNSPPVHQGERTAVACVARGWRTARRQPLASPRSLAVTSPAASLELILGLAGRDKMFPSLKLFSGSQLAHQQGAPGTSHLNSPQDKLVLAPGCAGRRTASTQNAAAAAAHPSKASALQANVQYCFAHRPSRGLSPQEES